MKTTRTLLQHASLTPNFWIEATSIATYLINRLPTKTLHMQSPYQKLYHKTPSYTHLKTFGCLCYPWIAYNRPHKLAAKSSPCIFLGYSSSHKGFRCFDPSNSKLIISRHVRFHETTFPMANTPTPIPQLNTQPFPTTPFLPLLPNPQHHQAISKSATIILPPNNTILPPNNTTPPTTKPLLYYKRRAQNPPKPAIPTSNPTSPSLPPQPPKPTTLPSSIQSSHTTLTRSKTKSNILDLPHTSTPLTYKTAHTIPHWKNAMQTEFQALLDQQTWTLVPKPPHNHILGSKWTFKTKLHPNGTIARHKARLVAQGYRQTQGVDYIDTFSPIAKIPTIRLFFIINFSIATGLSNNSMFQTLSSTASFKKKYTCPNLLASKIHPFPTMFVSCKNLYTVSNNLHDNGITPSLPSSPTWDSTAAALIPPFTSYITAQSKSTFSSTLTTS